MKRPYLDTNSVALLATLAILSLSISSAAGRRTSKLFDEQYHGKNGGAKVVRDQHAVKDGSGEIAVNATDADKRQGKQFSLFSIVTFANDACASTSALSGTTRRNGTCLTSTECTDRSGTLAGNCAAGFGVCCLFVFTSTSATVTQNCTYLQNPGFPSAYSDTTAISYTINKCSNNICDLRLDFESFTIQGTGVTTEDNGGLCVDMFMITTSTNMNFPTICGQNTGQHVYVDVGAMASDTATLAFTFSGAATNRIWEIKVSQIECGAGRNQPPEGCLQYFQGLTGRFTTFNFLPTSGETHLQNQEYSACIRAEEGFCCIQYTLCTDANSMSLFSSMASAGIDSRCTLDFVVIGASSNVCNQGQQSVVASKFCGVNLNNQDSIASNVPICDCTAPFTIGIVTDALTDAGDAATDNGTPGRGLCLEYMQIPCN